MSLQVGDRVRCKDDADNELLDLFAIAGYQGVTGEVLEADRGDGVVFISNDDEWGTCGDCYMPVEVLERIN